MVRTRTEIRALGATWNPTMLWYAKAVGALSDRPITSKLSWLYLGAMHGFDLQIWAGYGIIEQDAELPQASEQRAYWNQCQHQSWYFLPWHRAYLLTFEDILRDWITAQPGAPQDWALPYWNYSAAASAANPRPLAIPDAFLADALPDGSPNPLSIQARYGGGVDAGDAVLTKNLLHAFHRGRLGWRHSGIWRPDHALLQFRRGQRLAGRPAPQPRARVDVGGQDASGAGGLMSSPVTAAVDPVFWVHHANIDRLWEVWLRRDPNDTNPTDPAWLGGPKDKAFKLYDAKGVDRPSNPSDVIGMIGQVYTYDDFSDPVPGHPRGPSPGGARAPCGPRRAP